MKKSKLIIGGTLLLATSAIVSCILILWSIFPRDSDNVTAVSNSTLSMSHPDGVVIYGCGVSNYLQLQVGESKSLPEFMKGVGSVPTAVNFLFIATKGRRVALNLSDVDQVTQSKGYNITNGSVLILAHRDETP